MRYYFAVQDKSGAYVSLMKIEGNVGEVSVVACGKDGTPITTTIPFAVEYSDDITETTLDVNAETVFVPASKKTKEQK